MIEFAEELSKSGAQFRLFCSFDCTNEANGNVTMITGDGYKMQLPCCEEHGREINEGV